MDPVGGGGGANFKDSGHSLESGGRHHHRYLSSYPHHHHRQNFSGVAQRATWLLVVVGVVCLLLNQSAYHTELFQGNSSISGPKVFGAGNTISPSDNNTDPLPTPDVDVMWLRDPFPRFHPDGDFQISCDHFSQNYTDLNNSPNGGFNYVRSNNRTIQFYKFWHTAKYFFPKTHDQEVFNVIKFNPFIQEIGLEIRFFDTAYFGGFCEPSQDLDRVITMHANCCVGVESKIHDVKMVIEDWNKYMALLGSGKERNLSSRSWTVPRYCN